MDVNQEAECCAYKVLGAWERGKDDDIDAFPSMVAYVLDFAKRYHADQSAKLQAVVDAARQVATIYDVSDPAMPGIAYYVDRLREALKALDG